ncbi:gamma-aminobutyric acid receptor subunit beta-2-like isoform X2 [Branchiostoma floridae x Branchiostoma japonicum]
MWLSPPNSGRYPPSKKGNVRWASGNAKCITRKMAASSLTTSFPTIIILLLLSTSLIGSCSAQSGVRSAGVEPASSPTIAAADSSLAEILKNYDRNIRPNFGGPPVRVGLTMSIASIDSISEVNLDYTITVLLRQFWKDPRLAQPWLANKTRPMSLDGRLAEDLWVPDTFLTNAKEAFMHTVTTDNVLIRLYPDGSVIYGMRITAVAHCYMNLRKYPLDEQNCTLEFESYGYTTEDLQLYWMRGDESISGLQSVNEDMQTFQVGAYLTAERVAHYETGDYPRLIFSFNLIRLIPFFLLQTYFPAALIVMMSWVGFWISPYSEPARVSLGITTVLTMTTFITSARASVPRISYVKAIDVYLIICFLFSFGALIEYAIVNYTTLVRQKKETKRIPLTPLVVTDIQPSPVTPTGNDMQMVEVGNDVRDAPLATVSEADMDYENPSDAASTPSDDSGMGRQPFGNIRYRVRDRVRDTVKARTTQAGHRVRQTTSRVRRRVGKILDDECIIDRRSRYLFPIAFTLVNLVYWFTYIYVDMKDDKIERDF